MAKQNVLIDLFHSGQWNEITSDVLTRDGITITRGKADEGQQLKPQTAALTLNNRDGKYSPRNPRSPLFGLIGRNTPLRVRMPSLVQDTFTRTVVDGWGSADTGQAWTLDGAAADFDVDGSVGTIVGSSGAGQHAILGNFTDVDMVSRVRASTLDGEISLTARWVSNTDRYTFEIDLDTGSQNLDIWRRVDGVATNLASTAFTFVVDTWYWIRVQCMGSTLRMKAWTDGDPEPNDWSLSTVDTSHASGAVGCGAFNATGVKGFDDFEILNIRFTGEVAIWPPRWDLSGNDIWVPIQAAGITRRHGRAQTTLRDVIHRFMTQDTSGDLVAYWPMDDPRGSHIARAVLGTDLRSDPEPGQFIKFRDLPEFGQALHDWLPSAMKLTTESGRMKAPVVGTVAGEFLLSWLYRADRSTADSNPISTRFRLNCGEFSFEILIAGIIEDITVRAFGPSGLIESNNTGIRDTTDGETHHFQFHMFEFAASTSVRLSVDLDGEEIFADNVDLGVDVPPPVDSITLEWIGSSPDATITTNIGQVSLWNEQPANLDEFVNIHTMGHSGEPANERFARLLTEEEILHAVIGAADEQSVTSVKEEVLLGPQFPGKLVDILREIRATGQGFLYESRQSNDYVYRTIGSAYNQEAALELDYAATEVAPNLEPTEDDQNTANDVVANRRGGGEVRLIRTSGPMGVDEVGRYDVSTSPNVAGDGNLLVNQARWRLHLGTVDEPRYPQIVVDLDANPELASAAGGLDVGDRIIILNPPDWLPPELISQLILGYTETIESHRRKITFNCTPESPYHIAEVEHTDYSILGSGAATVQNAGLSETDTNWTIALNEGAEFVHEVDFDILVGGERMTVQAVDSPTGTFPNQLQQLTSVVRSVNGIVKSHPDGTRVELFHKSYIGL